MGWMYHLQTATTYEVLRQLGVVVSTKTCMLHTYLHVQTNIPISMMKYDGMCTDFPPRSREAGRQEAKGSTGQLEETRSCVGVLTLALDI